MTGSKEIRDQRKPLYFPPAHPVLLDVPEMPFIKLEGTGGPGPAFQEALGILFGVAYTLRFSLKKQGLDRPVFPLEALWWVPGEESVPPGRAGDMHWIAMISLANDVTAENVATAVEELRAKKDPPGLDRLVYERWEEGPSAQIMHIGPYDAEPPTIARLHDFIADQGRKVRGNHHEIYIGDPNRSAPEKLRTVIRQPVSQ